MYPQHFARRMQFSSCLFSISILHSLYCGFYDICLIVTMVMICSLNHWRYPVFGIRRSMDLLTAQIGVFHHLYIAYSYMNTTQWNTYFYVGILGLLVWYAGALGFGLKGNQDYASRCHSTMHIWGIIANSYLYSAIYGLY